MSENTETPTQKPRQLTMKFVNKRVDDVNVELGKTNGRVEAATKHADGAHKRIDETNSMVESILQELGIADHHLKELQRAKRGTTLANSRVAAIEEETKRLSQNLEELNTLVTDRPDIAGAYSQEFERINTRLDELFGQATSEVGTLRGRVDELSGTVAGHSIAIEMLDEGQSSLNGRVDDVNHRVTLIERLRDKVSWWPTVIGLGVGVFMFVFVLLPYTFTDSLTLPDGEVITQPNPHYNLWWWKLLIALGVAAITTGALTLISLIVSSISRRAKSNRHEDNNEAPAIPLAPHPVVNTSSASAGDTAPTRVLEPQGATSGTR